VSRVGEKSGSAVEWTGMRESGSFGYPSGARYGIYTAYSAAVIKWFFWLLINTSIIVERME
jgi:hypothetical protein